MSIRAGAMGFTTSRTRNHQTPDGQPVASRLAEWSEVRELVGVMGELGAGVFEIAGEDTGAEGERVNDYLHRLKSLAVDTRVPVTFGMFSYAPCARLLASVLHDGRRDRAGGRPHVHPGS